MAATAGRPPLPSLTIPKASPLDAGGDLFIADTGNNRVREVVAPNIQGRARDAHRDRRQHVQGLRAGAELRRNGVYRQRPGQRRFGHGRDSHQPRGGGVRRGGHLSHLLQAAVGSGLSNYTITYVGGA